MSDGRFTIATAQISPRLGLTGYLLRDTVSTAARGLDARDRGV